MDIRQPIHDTPEPTVLSVAFSEDGFRFICGMDNGIRIFRSRDCVRTLKKAPGPGHGIAIAETLDDRNVAVVGGGRHPNSPLSRYEFWDMVRDKCLFHMDIIDPILGIRVNFDYVAVIYIDSVIIFKWSKSNEDNVTAIPAKPHNIYKTASNPHALCCISDHIMVLPGLTPGQVQVLGLVDNSKRIIPAHQTALRAISLSKDGDLLATTSQQGTLIRVFSTRANTQTHEFRRGLDHALIYGLAISPTKQFIALTSDKGTLHIFDLRPRSVDQPRPMSVSQRRVSNARPAAVQRARPGSMDFDNVSIPSGSSSPMTAAAGFYGPPSDIAHTPPPYGPSVLAALARLPGIPRAFTDPRSMGEPVAYYLGADPPNWQGQATYTTTTLPSGNSKKIRNPNVSVPGRPDGKAPKGVVAWDPSGDDRRLWIVGGGADARWEVFEIGEEDKVVKKGFKKFLTRQYPEGG